jgi:hypothetical protein
MKLIRIKNFPNRAYAEHAKQQLEQENIPAVIQAPDMGILGAGGTAGLPQGVDLYVPDELADEAREILTALFNGI